jgi:hypothetical protein
VRGYDTTALHKTSEAEDVPWRARDVALVWITREGHIRQAAGIEDKRVSIREAHPDDVLLLAWPGRWRQDIFVIDDRSAALQGLEPDDASSAIGLVYD